MSAGLSFSILRCGQIIQQQIPLYQATKKEQDWEYLFSVMRNIIIFQSHYLVPFLFNADFNVRKNKKQNEMKMNIILHCIFVFTLLLYKTHFIFQKMKRMVFCIDVALRSSLTNDFIEDIIFRLFLIKIPLFCYPHCYFTASETTLIYHFQFFLVNQ